MKIFNILMMVPAFICISGYAQHSHIKKDKWHWNQAGQDTVAGYAQVLKVDNVLYISGVVGAELTATDVDRVYKSLDMALKSNGATFQNVVKENLYTTDIDQMKKPNQVRKKYYNNDFPAATWVQISRLYMENAKLEVELIAHLPK